MKNPDIKTVDINSVFQDPENARVHSDSQLQTIAASLSRFGQQKPIIVGKDNVIIAGNGTHRAARDVLNWREIVVCFSDLSNEEARAYGIADNQIATQSEWDLETLSRHIKDLSQWNPVQDWSSIGFDDSVIHPIIDTEVEQGAKAIEQFLASESDKQSEEKKNKPEMGNPIKVTEEMRQTIDYAITVLRMREGDYTMTEGRCIELICADWVSGESISKK